MNVKELLKKCQRGRTAVLATNFYNFETLTAVMQAAQRMQAPVLLQLTRSSIDYMGLEQAVGMGRRAIADYGVEGWIHLDHGGSVELVERCLDAGFDSVMIDASERPFDENVSTTRRVVELARPYGVNVEAELGYVAKLGQAQGGGFTTPEEAALATEIKDNFMRALKGVLLESEEIDLRKVFPKAVAPVVELLCEKYRMVGSSKVK